MSEIPVFDFEYNDVYTSKIEFSTCINEKQKGREQRYPVWTYPKRTFKLKFDKTYSQREELENFFIDIAGTDGKFHFTWAVEKGGNDKTYTCSFNQDSFEQLIQEYGFSQSSLELITIDDSSVVDGGDFDFWHSAETSFSVAYTTIKDKIFTSHYQNKTYLDYPKRRWILKFQKNAETRKLIENFFISKRGKFRSFQWKWDKDKGGDNNTYNVRFDTDELNLDINDYGFSEFEIPIKEVFVSSNPLSETEKDEIIPRKLLKIFTGQNPINILDNETLETIYFDGETYIGAPLTYGEITKDDNTAVNKINVQLSNVGLSISGIIANRGDIITNSKAILTQVFLNVNTNEIIQNLSEIIYVGRCNNLSLDYETASVDIETKLGGYEILAPIMKYQTSCQVRRFKDCRCGYTGEETSCDRTFTTCQRLGNTQNFMGFPTMFNELVIKV